MSAGRTTQDSDLDVRAACASTAPYREVSAAPTGSGAAPRPARPPAWRSPTAGATSPDGLAGALLRLDARLIDTLDRAGSRIAQVSTSAPTGGDEPC